MRPMPGVDRRALHHGSLLGDGFELSLGHLDVLAQGLDLVAGGGEDGRRASGMPGVGVFDQGPHLRQHLLDAPRG